MKNLRRTGQVLRHYGLSDAWNFLALGVARRLKLLKRVEVFRLARSSLYVKYLFLPAGYQLRVLSRKELMRCSEQGSGLEMQRDFVEQALANGDRCLALLHGGEVVSYGWCSGGPTDLSPAIRFSFDADHVYLYKTFTRPDHRGKRLQAVLAANALLRAEQVGRKGVITFVDRSNPPSLRAVRSIGHKRLGSVYLFNLPGKPVAWLSPGCKEIGARLQLDCQQSGSSDLFVF